jgi:hypothetical protein
MLLAGSTDGLFTPDRASLPKLLFGKFPKRNVSDSAFQQTHPYNNNANNNNDNHDEQRIFSHNEIKT